MSENDNKQSYDEDLSKIAKNAGISGFGEILFNAFGYASSILITRTVGPSIFGVFSLANIVLNVANIFSNAGLGHGLLRFVAFYKAREDYSRLKGTIIFGTITTFLLSLFFSITIYSFSDMIATRIFHNPDVGSAIKVLLISLPFFTVGSVWLKCIQSFQEIKYQVYAEKIIQPAIRLIALGVLFLIGYKLYGILTASIISIVAGSILSFYYLQKIFPIHKKLPVAEYENKKIINFSLPVTFTQFLRVVTIYTDVLMIGYFMTAYEVGIYSAVVKIAMLITLPLISFTSIFAPMISEFYSRKEMEKLEDLYKIVTKWIITLSLPVFLIFALFPEVIMGMFGKEFTVGAIALVAFAGFQLIDAGVGPAGMVILMVNRPKYNLFATLVFCVLNIILNYLLIPVYGIIGAVIATGISIVVVNVLKVAGVYVFLKIQPFKWNYLKPFIAGSLSFAVLLFFINDRSVLPVYNVALLSMVFLGLYAFFIYLLKLDDEDKYILNLIYKKIMKSKRVAA